MEKSYTEKGYIIGVIVRQHYHTEMYDDAVITCVHENGALDVRIDGVVHGWSVNFCTPVPRIVK